MKTVPLGGKKAAGRVVRVDDGDYDLVMQYRWTAREQRGPTGAVWGTWAKARVPGGGETTVMMHTLLTGWPRTDHKDGDGLNNQRSNLRPASAAQNRHNQRPVAGHSSCFKGVGWNRRKRKWVAQIKVSGKNRHLGYFAREEDAAHAYTEASLAIQGEYAYAARDAVA